MAVRDRVTHIGPNRREKGFRVVQIQALICQFVEEAHRLGSAPLIRRCTYDQAFIEAVSVDWDQLNRGEIWSLSWLEVFTSNYVPL